MTPKGPDDTGGPQEDPEGPLASGASRDCFRSLSAREGAIPKNCHQPAAKHRRLDLSDQ